MLGLFFANTPAAIAPWGGELPVFGTNPIAFAAPLQGEVVIVDFSVSKVARGRLVAAKQRGEKIPEGWALDPRGNPTSDPNEGLAGTMLPMGDAKGAALAFIVEVLAGCLAGAHLAFEASSFLDAKGPPPETGQLLLAMDPTAFGNSFSERMATLASAIQSQKGARIPGARRLSVRQMSFAEGISVPPELMV